MYIVKANATDRDGNDVSVYVSNDLMPTLQQRDAKRYESKDDVPTFAKALGFRAIKLVPRSRS